MKGILLVLLLASIQLAYSGHLENSSESQLNAFKNNLKLVPEYKEGQSIVVSYLLPLVDKSGVEIILETLKSGAPNVYIMAPKNRENVDFLESFSLLKNALGTLMSKVIFIDQEVGMSREDHKKYMEENAPGPFEINQSITFFIPTVWARDWAPMSAIGMDKKVKMLDFNYFPDRPIDDLVPTLFSNFKKNERVSVPVYLEGGNLMINDDGECFTTTQVIKSNKAKKNPSDKILNREDIIGYLKEFAGCKEVTIFENFPVEATGHIDMWAKIVSNKTVVISEVWDETIEAIPDFERYTPMYLNLQKSYLNDRAKDFKNKGFNVIRIPTAPIKALWNGSKDRPYTNALQLGTTVLVPRYTIKNQEKYEQSVSEGYEKAGLKVVFINTDELIMMAGSIHCSTMQILVLP